MGVDGEDELFFVLFEVFCAADDCFCDVPVSSAAKVCGEFWGELKFGLLLWFGGVV